jgi:hypothetical protein
MKNGSWIIISIVLIVALSGIGYFVIPVLIEKDTAELRSDVKDLKQRIQKIEEESKAAPLEAGADVQKIVKTVNALHSKVNAAESSFKKDLLATNEEIKNHLKAIGESLNAHTEAIKKQKAAAEEALKKEAESIDKLNKEFQAQIQTLKFDAAMANIRGHVLKAKLDLDSKNIGTAKNELNVIEQEFGKVKTSASDEKKKIIGELQSTLKKANTEIDTDLPAAINRIELLWHEMSILLKKG